MIAPELAEDREFGSEFQREFEAEVSIRHPNVVRVFGAGAKDGRAVRDDAVRRRTDLASLLVERKRLQPATAARLIAQVADGVEPPRDRGSGTGIKPANVLIEGEVTRCTASSPTSG